MNEEAIDRLQKLSKKSAAVIDERFLEGRTPTLNNICIDLDQTNSLMNERHIKYLIEALHRSEHSTLGYSAAGFVPVLFLLNSMEFLQNIDDKMIDTLALSSTIVLGFSGIYYAAYKSLYLGPKRILLEGYLSGIISRYRFYLMPRGLWQVPNFLALLFIPVGYLMLLIMLIKVLLA